jgi:hypothetical protein
MKESTRLVFKRKCAGANRRAAREQLGDIPTLTKVYGEKWPACSPIENFWAWLDRKAKKKVGKAKKATELQAEVNRLLETKELKEHIQTLLASFFLREEMHLRIQLPRGSW